MPTVAIADARGDLVEAFGGVLELAGLGDIVQPGSKVLLKPNQHGGNGFTSPKVLAAGARWAFAQGAGEVWIGDGAVWSLVGEAAQEYFARSGLLGACEESGATPLDFHAGEFEVFEPKSPDLPATLGFSRYVYEADVVINLPVMKTHFNTLVTLGVKNLKGCIRPIDKRTLHEMELNRGIAEFARLLAPQITCTVVDGTVAYEGMGPGSGTPVEMGLLIASDDIVAADAVTCDLMGIDPRQARLLSLAAEKGIGTLDLSEIAIVGEDPDQHRRRFQLPYEAMAESFPNLRICSENACSGCAMNLFRALDIAGTHKQEITCQTVIIGPSVETEGQTVLVGKCTKAGWDGAPHVPGCPPTVDAIREALTGIPSGDAIPKT